MKAKTIIIEAVGHLFAYYRDDLGYIKSFQDYKQSHTNSFAISIHTEFKRFLAGYRVTRNIQKGQIENLLKTLIAHVQTDQADDVDFLASKLRKLKITHDKTMISLASKILFLNNPWKILPYDRFVRMGIGYAGNNYSGYLSAVQRSKERILKLYNDLPSLVPAYLRHIEDEAAPNMPRLDEIRERRFTDKLLLILGRHNILLENIVPESISLMDSGETMAHT